MISRRDFLQVSVAASALVGASGFGQWARVAAQQALTQDQLLEFEPLGNVTLIHLTDLHAQLKPVYFREPGINIGMGEAAGQPPHVTGKDFLKLYNIEAGSPGAYALTNQDFVSLAKGYGRVGGMDRVSTRFLHCATDRGAGRRQRHEPVEARRDDLTLGVHVRHRPGE